MSYVAQAIGFFLGAIIITIILASPAMRSSQISRHEERQQDGDWHYRYYKLDSERGDDRAFDENVFQEYVDNEMEER